MKVCSQRHSYHLVSISPWPLFCSLGALGLTFGFAMYFHEYEGGQFLIELALLHILINAGCWWRDVIREGTIECYHTAKVINGLKMGMLLFIVSEIMFFFAFFWSYFYFSFNADIAVGSVWPPVNIEGLDPFEVPLLNTILLLSSGASLTWAHHSLVLGDKREVVVGLGLTIFLGVIFTNWQAFEYAEAPFSMSDSVYGSIFYLTTGFHGFHVLVGTWFLKICSIRLTLGHFTQEQHLGFEFAAWYWHFVDVVWLFLYIVFYIWGGL